VRGRAGRPGWPEESGPPVQAGEKPLGVSSGRASFVFTDDSGPLTLLLCGDLLRQAPQFGSWVNPIAGANGRGLRGCRLCGTPGRRWGAAGGRCCWPRTVGCGPLPIPSSGRPGWRPAGGCELPGSELPISFAREQRLAACPGACPPGARVRRPRSCGPGCRRLKKAHQGGGWRLARPVFEFGTRGVREPMGRNRTMAHVAEAPARASRCLSTHSRG